MLRGVMVAGFRQHAGLQDSCQPGTNGAPLESGSRKWGTAREYGENWSVLRSQESQLTGYPGLGRFSEHVTVVG